ncbi:MAG: MTH1187 family thiamine-binding protein [Halobacteriaceae archaeon]
MTVIAFLSVAPVTKESMSSDVAAAIRALDDFDIDYELTSMGTIIETDDIQTLMEAVTAAHRAVDGDRISTFLKVDDKRTSDEPASRKVESVERKLADVQ